MPATTPVPNTQTPPATLPASPPLPAQTQPAKIEPKSVNDEIDALSQKAPAVKPEDQKGKSEAESPPGPAKESPDTNAAEPADDDYLVQSEKASPQAPITDAGPVKAKELREAYQSAKKRVAELEKAVEEAKSKPIDDSERKTYVEQISSLQKQFEEASERAKFADYESSEEYKKKHEEPFVEAWNAGAATVARMTVTDAEGNTRKGTPEDFAAVMREGDDQRASQIASEMFGVNAPIVLFKREKLLELQQARKKALADFRATAAERFKSEQESTRKAREEMEQNRIKSTAMFQALNKQASEKFPELFGPDENDEEGNKLLERGYANADLAFTGGGNLTEEQRIKLHSAIRNRSAAFGRLVHRLKQRDAKIEQLTKEIADLRSSTPQGGQLPKNEQRKAPLSFEEEIDNLAHSR